MDIESLVNNSIIPRKGLEAALGLPPDIQLTTDGIISELKIVPSKLAISSSVALLGINLPLPSLGITPNPAPKSASKYVFTLTEEPPVFCTFKVKIAE